VSPATNTTSLAHFAEPDVRFTIGGRIVVGDDEGNMCNATITDLGGDGAVTLVLDLGTFRAADADADADAYARP
jgi:hypothetical protein